MTDMHAEIGTLWAGTAFETKVSWIFIIYLEYLFMSFIKDALSMNVFHQIMHKQWYPMHMTHHMPMKELSLVNVWFFDLSDIVSFSVGIFQFTSSWRQESEIQAEPARNDKMALCPPSQVSAHHKLSALSFDFGQRARQFYILLWCPSVAVDAHTVCCDHCPSPPLTTHPPDDPSAPVLL